MIINYNLAKLQAALNDFYIATGVHISLSDLQFRYVAEVSVPVQDFCVQWKKNGGASACRIADEKLFRLCEKTREIQIHRCHAGLVDICIPVQKDGVLLAYLIMGRMREFDELPESAIVPDRAEAERLYRSHPLYTKERATSIANLATILTTYILSEDLILAKKSDEAERLISYIDKHLQKPLCAEQICRDMHLSKTMLYRLFHDHMGCGVNQYVTAKRIQRAKELLLHSTLSVSEICERIGIPNSTYFCRLFKQKTGMSPLRYRKNS